MAAPGLTAAHRRRLRELWRSAGWPCHDGVELDLLAAGLLHCHCDEQGRKTLHLTDAGLQALAAERSRHQAALGAHEALVARVAREMQRAGRLVWRGLSLRAPLPAAAAEPPPADDEQAARATPRTQWVMAMPDVFSIRLTTVEDYTEPIVHEIKVNRADLLSDLRSFSKGQAYLALASQCWYVLRRGIAQPEEVPAAFGVMLADNHALEVARPAPCRAMRVPFAVWMALARAPAEITPDDDQQSLAPCDPFSSGCDHGASDG